MRVFSSMYDVIGYRGEKHPSGNNKAQRHPNCQRLHRPSASDTYPDGGNWTRDYEPDILVGGKGHSVLANPRLNMYGQSTYDSPVSTLCARFAPHLAVLREAFPDRKVIPFASTALNIRGGGVRCATKNIAKASK